MLDVNLLAEPLQQTIIDALQVAMPSNDTQYLVAWPGAGPFASVIFGRFTLTKDVRGGNFFNVGWGGSCMITKLSPSYTTARYTRVKPITCGVWFTMDSPPCYFIPPGHPHYATTVQFVGGNAQHS